MFHKLSPIEGQAGTAGLLIFDRDTLGLQAKHSLPYIRDIHGIWANDEIVYAVSTGTDEIFELRLVNHLIQASRCIWRPDASAALADHYHLNSVYRWNERVLVSGFGRKLSMLWGSATDGFIVDIRTGRTLVSGIHHPHSMAELGPDLAFCESRSAKIRTIKGRHVPDLPGYTRGLCRAGTYLYVGTSRGRRTSKSTGLINNPADPGTPAGECMVCQLDAATLAVEAIFDLGAYGDEVFDLLAVPTALSARWM